MAYKQIVPADGWCFCSVSVNNKGECVKNSMFQPIAVWALRDDGEIVGLVSINSNQRVNTLDGGVGPNTLIEVARIAGCYRPISSLSEEELKLLNKY